MRASRRGITNRRFVESLEARWMLAGDGVETEFTAIGDFNGDKIPDLAVLYAKPQGPRQGQAARKSSIDDALWHLRQSIHLGDGSGGFELALESTAKVPWVPVLMAAGDFDGDGTAELVIMVRHSGDSSTSQWGYIGLEAKQGFSLKGAGLQAESHPLKLGESGPVGWIPVVGDWNGDGRFDLSVFGFTPEPLLASSLAARPVVGLLSGADVNSLVLTSRIELPEEMAAASGVAGVFPADGKPELFIWDDRSGKIALLSPADPTTVQIGDNPLYDLADTKTLRTLAIGDLDGDGDLDVIGQVGGDLYAASVLVDKAEPVLLGCPKLADDTQVAVGDLDGDGDLDLVVASGGQLLFGLSKTATSPSGVEHTMIWDSRSQVWTVCKSARTYIWDSRSQVWNAFRSGGGFLSLGDLDGDGDLDVITLAARDPRDSDVFLTSLIVEYLDRDSDNDTVPDIELRIGHEVAMNAIQNLKA